MISIPHLYFALFAIRTSCGTSISKEAVRSSGNESAIYVMNCHEANCLCGQFGTVHDRIDCKVAISKLLGPEMSRISARICKISQNEYVFLSVGQSVSLSVCL